jgi:hypothetical protein
MAFVRTFTDDEFDAIRGYCEGQLRDEVANVLVARRDLSAEIVLVVELMDGWRVFAVAVADGNHDGDAGKGLVAEIRRQAALARQQTAH